MRTEPSGKETGKGARDDAAAILAVGKQHVESPGRADSRAADYELRAQKTESRSLATAGPLRLAVRRSVRRAILVRWLKRLRIAETIVAWASFEADVLIAIGEFVRCVASHYLLRC